MSCVLFISTEYTAQKEDIANSIKATYEKVLNTERTLKTQVQILWNNCIIQYPGPHHWKLLIFPYAAVGGEQAGGDHEQEGHEAGPEEEGQYGRPEEEGEGEPQTAAGAQPGKGQVQPHGHQVSEGAQRDAGRECYKRFS